MDVTQQELARQLIDNKFFEFVFGTMIQSLDEQMNSLSPIDKDGFTVIRSQQMILESMRQTVLNATMDVEEEEKEHVEDGEYGEGEVL